jgi:predicted nucleic acid-binding protein
VDSRAVVDASVLVRAIFERRRTDATDWLVAIQDGAVEAIAPDFVYAEAANGLARYARGGLLTERRLVHALRVLAGLAIESAAARPLVEPAARIALHRGLSVYDACYAVVAEASGAPLVTADRRLAAATRQSVLLA